MADKKKFERVITPVGVAVYPHLTKPDTKYDPAGVYKTKLRVPAAEAAELIERLEKIRDEAYAELDAAKRKKLKLADVCEVELDEDGNETGFVIFSAKLKATVIPKDGDPWEQEPIIWDSQNNRLPLKGLSIWGGSKIRLSCDVIPFELAQAKLFGVALRLRQVQIIELVEGGGGESPFDKVDGYTYGAGSSVSDERGERDDANDDDSGADF